MDFKSLITFLVLAVATINAQSNSTKFIRNYLNYNISVLRTDNYLDLNRRQYADYILECDKEVDKFKIQYTERISTINQLLEMLITDILKTNERLNPLEVLSDISKDCVAKYRSKVPTVATTKSSIQSCINAATAQLNNLVSAPLTTKNNLQSYYTNNVEKDLKACTTRYPALDNNYTECLAKVIAAATAHTRVMMKQFYNQMDAAHCTSKAHVKSALDCSYNAQSRSITTNAEANFMIDKCIHGQDDCERCSEGRFCESVYYVPQFQVDYNNSTMLNPFYGRNSTTNCLLIEVY